MTCTLHIVLGDDNGGLHAHIVLGKIPKDAEHLTDAEVAEPREAARKVYSEAFGVAAESCVVYVEDDVDAP